MATVFDVAAYILTKQGTMTAMKLQKLCYYSQAWHLVWEEKELFSEEIQAWANGPVIPALYSRHRGEFKVSEIEEGNPEALTETEKESIEVVLESYGKLSAHSLSELTHSEAPWKEARKNIPSGERSNSVIPLASIHEYYDSQTTEL